MPGATVSWRVRASLMLFLSACTGAILVLICFRPQQYQPPTIAIVAPITSFMREPIQPLSAPLNLDPGKVELGRELFHAPCLSANNSVSCASCHSLRTGGVDRKIVSEGIYHRHGKRNSPTVFNVAMNYRQLWDGRAATLEDQVTEALQAKAVMDTTWKEVVMKLRQDAHFATTFARLYTEGIVPVTVRDALATYERSLVTPNCRFDRYLRGENGALNSTELAGYRLFKSLGCISCHQGRNVGGGMMQPFGVLQSPHRLGKGAVRGENRQGGNISGTLYKVPSLRNVALTAPYFHDGAVNSLPKAIRVMSDVQLCRYLSDDEVRQIVAFLRSLTGTYEGKPL